VVVKSENETQDRSRSKWEENRPRSRGSGRGKRLQKGESKTRRWESKVRVRVIFRVHIPRRVRCNLATTPGVGAHLGRAGQEPKTDPRGVVRLVERTAVGEG
jgi:hypothetical protein